MEEISKRDPRMFHSGVEEGHVFSTPHSVDQLDASQKRAEYSFITNTVDEKVSRLTSKSSRKSRNRESFLPSRHGEMARISIPTTARLPPSLLVDPSNAAALKILHRLSRTSLLTLVLDWLADSNQSLCPPLLRSPEASEDEDDESADFYPPASSLADLRAIYTDLQAAKGSRRDVLDRIVDGDWRNGLSLYQLAMADLQYLYDHPTSLKWSAYKIQRLKAPANEAEAEGDNGGDKPDRETLQIPRFHPSTFLRNLQAEVLPDVKAHYTFDRHRTLPAYLLRIWVLDSPYNTSLAVSSSTSSSSASAASFDASRTIYIAFPDASPHLYISRAASSGAVVPGEARSLRALVVDGVPKALSRPRERYALRPTSLATRNLDALLAVKGPGRTNAAGGGWGIYAEEKGSRARGVDSPLNPVLPSPPLSEDDPADEEETGAGTKGRKRARDPVEEGKERVAKRARLVARARFGGAALVDDGKGVERVDIKLEDAFPDAPPAVTEAEPSPEPGAEEEESQQFRTSRRSKGRVSGLEREFEQLRNQDGDAADQGAGAEEGWRPTVRLTFHGPHVFAGIRQLVEAGIIDGERMPGWMTGEDGVTIGNVRYGRIRGFKGSGV